MWKSIVESKTKDETKAWQIAYWADLQKECGGTVVEPEVEEEELEVGGGGGWSGLSVGIGFVASVIICMIIVVVVTHIFTVKKIELRIESLEEQVRETNAMIKLLVDAAEANANGCKSIT